MVSSEGLEGDKMGSRFNKLVKQLEKKGARTPRALAAWIGRRKYGKKTYQAMAAAGRRKKSRKRK